MMTSAEKSMLVTLLTDFGTADYFVAAMKGVILSADPRVPIIDISHDIPPQDIQAAAFTLLAVYSSFPAATIHVAVVDPGVGSRRRPVLVATDMQRFVGPDNGLFSYVLDREPGARIFHLTRERYFRHPVSTTFHGRDVFAPVAAALVQGVAPAELGQEVTDPVRLPPLRPQPEEDGRLRASIIHIDRFGNCATSISRRDLPPGEPPRGMRLEVAGREIRDLRRFYAEGDAGDGELFTIWGSAGFLEIAANRDSAARLLGVERGERLWISWLDES
jgi:S-adenosyl-L-methionine hydrolase (adenosine-forming)